MYNLYLYHNLYHTYDHIKNFLVVQQNQIDLDVFHFHRTNDTSNEYAVVVGETDLVFTFNFRVENIKIIPGAYDVVVSSKLLSKFSNTQYDLQYYIALEPDSTFG